MIDRLASLLEHFSVKAHLFHAGTLCGSHLLQANATMGQLHLIRHGTITVFHGADKVHIDRPSLLLYPRPITHRFESPASSGADMACAHLIFEGGIHNSIANALPDVVCMALEDIPETSQTLSLLFDEAFAQRCGRSSILNRLFEVVFIQVLRHLMERNQVHTGMLAGLAHPHLRFALVALHTSPSKVWGLNELSKVCGMSRSVFANTFRDIVGCTPGVYLQKWRILVAQGYLRKGLSLKHITDAVGYSSEAAFSRAFRAHVGMPPRQWREMQKLASNASPA